jgi:signal transduction histidine kinase
MKPKDQMSAGSKIDVTDFVLSNLSHELRTPLSAILLWTKVLSEQLNPSKQQLLEGLRAIRECAEEQEAMIEDMVDDSRVAVGKIELRPERVGLRELIEHAVDPYKNGLGGKAPVIHQSFDPTLGEALVDPRRFRQVIGGLVDNAIKRCLDGGLIVISAERKGDSIQISVKDTGRGFSADEGAHVFDRFLSGTTQWQGKRNALYTASRLAFLLKGSLVAKSSGHESGAIFTFTLAAPSATAPSAESAADEGEKRLVPSFGRFHQDAKKNCLMSNQNLGLA